MGIKGLSQLLQDYAIESIKNTELENYFGRKIAIDASTSIYQFLVSVRTEGNTLENDSGETTSHLMGIFYRTIRMCEKGIKPCYVFDGSPPELKNYELSKRTERREETKNNIIKAQETGDTETVTKLSRRLVKATKQHSEDCIKLLNLMGIPTIQAPCEAEAQCSELVKSGIVFATGTEDMDALTFGSSVLLRRMTFSEAKKMPIQEFSLNHVLESLNLSMDQFIDLCILLGCDYCETISQIGPSRALNLIREHHTIETILTKIDTTKHKVVPGWKYKEARNLFKNPSVLQSDGIKLCWKAPDIDGLIQFMCEEKGFNSERIRNAALKLQKINSSSVQGRMDSFFKVLPVVKKVVNTKIIKKIIKKKRR